MCVWGGGGACVYVGCVSVSSLSNKVHGVVCACVAVV